MKSLTLYDLLVAWQAGHMSYREALHLSQIETLDELYDAAALNGVQIRTTMTPEEIAMGEIVGKLLADALSSPRSNQPSRPQFKFTDVMLDYPEIRREILKTFPPHYELPKFDIPRFWSNPGLTDPTRIVSLIIANPTMADLARAIHAYGPDLAIECAKNMIENGSLDANRTEYTLNLLKLALEGVAEAASEIKVANLLKHAPDARSQT